MKVQWEPGQEFKNLRAMTPSSTRSQPQRLQAAVIKAIKDGKTNADLNAPTTRIIRQAVLPQVVQTPVRPA
ncbi:hypothetical protein [Segatella copri]|uniref:hypothetical protein n=1 Tax=Segatella copri TaxID=165179 RepID=UPI00222E3B90|nr:hypothetical protein [Segatella copri]MCW4081067.1 hypothetical protein [Segatella copri]